MLCPSLAPLWPGSHTMPVLLEIPDFWTGIRHGVDGEKKTGEQELESSAEVE